MPTRTVTGVVKRSNGAPWAGASVRFRPRDDTFTLAPDESFPFNDVIATTAADGTMTVELVTDLDVAYEVTMPDEEKFPIVVPAGGPITLEVLRASYAGEPEALDNIQSVVEALLADPVVVANISHTDIGDVGLTPHTGIDSHIASIANPHGVTKGQVGLSNVDNTSDVAKPVSTAQATALAGKLNTGALLTQAVVVQFGDGVNNIVVGDKRRFSIPVAHTLIRWRITTPTTAAEDNTITDWNEVGSAGDVYVVNVDAAAAGAMTFDIWRDAFANFPPVLADSISTSKPTIGSGATNDVTLELWYTRGIV